MMLGNRNVFVLLGCSSSSSYALFRLIKDNWKVVCGCCLLNCHPTIQSAENNCFLLKWNGNYVVHQHNISLQFNRTYQSKSMSLIKRDTTYKVIIYVTEVPEVIERKMIDMKSIKWISHQNVYIKLIWIRIWLSSFLSLFCLRVS